MSARGALVLIVDDNDDIREMYAESLAYEGYETATAVDGKDAIEKVRRLRPAVVLMDVGMPVMDGIEATTHLKGDPETAAIPVIAVTGQGPDAVQAMRAARADAICTKPCMPSELVEAIERVRAANR